MHVRFSRVAFFGVIGFVFSRQVLYLASSALLTATGALFGAVSFVFFATGALFGAIGLCQTSTTLVSGFLFSAIYAHTLAISPGFVFLFVAVLYVMASLLVL